MAPTTRKMALQASSATTSTLPISPPTNHQLQSPLFGILPGELRNDVFALALMQYDDDADAYAEDSYWFRPGFSAPRKSSSALLRTCKAAYAEGQKVYLRDEEWAFWFNRGPEGRTGNQACISFFHKLTPQAAAALQKVRFFTQMYWLEDGHELNYMFTQPQFRPTSLTITIRYSDWWNWERNAALSMSDNWLREFAGSPGLRKLSVEYETLSSKRDEMMRIVERNKKFKLGVRREGKMGTMRGRKGTAQACEWYLSAESTALVEWKWKGKSELGGEKWDHHPAGDTIEYVVVQDTWVFMEGGRD